MTTVCIEWYLDLIAGMFSSIETTVLRGCHAPAGYAIGTITSTLASSKQRGNKAPERSFSRRTRSTGQPAMKGWGGTSWPVSMRLKGFRE